MTGISEDSAKELIEIYECPFCGGVDIGVHHSGPSEVAMECQMCRALGPSVYPRDINIGPQFDAHEKAAAAMAWNARARSKKTVYFEVDDEF